MAEIFAHPSNDGYDSDESIDLEIPESLSPHNSNSSLTECEEETSDSDSSSSHQMDHACEDESPIYIGKDGTKWCKISLMALNLTNFQSLILKLMKKR